MPSRSKCGLSFSHLAPFTRQRRLEELLLAKLKFFYAKGDAHTVYQLCTVIEDLGMDVFRDESGAFIPSRGSNEAEKNLGVARRFLERQNGEPDGAANGSQPFCSEGKTYVIGGWLPSLTLDR